MFENANPERLPTGQLVLNVTPHYLPYIYEGMPNAIPNSEVLIRADYTKKQTGYFGKTPIFEDNYVANPKVQQAINEYVTNHPNIVLLGSRVSAQCYKNVYCLTYSEEENRVFIITEFISFHD